MTQKRNRRQSTDNPDDEHSHHRIQQGLKRAGAVRLVFSRAGPSVPPTEALLSSAHAELLTATHKHDECH